MIVSLDEFRCRAGERAQAAASADEGRAAVCHVIKSARQARENMNCALQQQIAEHALRMVGTPSCEDDLLLYVRASDLVVDAMSNQTHHAKAEAKARETHDLAKDLAPGSVASFSAERQISRALELCGKPDDAMRLQMAAYLKLRARGRLGLDGELEKLLSLQVVLSSAKRVGGQEARRFAATARQHGDVLAAALESQTPGLVAYYRQWAGFAMAWLAGNGSQYEEAADTLTWALQHRRTTTRDQLTSDMIVAEIRLLRGDRAESIALFDRTRERFLPSLPRKYESATDMLKRRGLVA